MFGGFDVSGAKSVRATSQTLEGEGVSTVVVACTLEIEGVDGELTEYETQFKNGETMTVATFAALIAALNAAL